MADAILCHRCGCSLRAGRGELYVVRIEAVADPSPPELDEEDFAGDPRTRMDELSGELERLSPQEAMDQVHRRLTLTLCNRCYREWIEEPC